MIKITARKSKRKIKHIKCSANSNLFKVSNRDTRKWCEIYSNINIKTPERRERRYC